MKLSFSPVRSDAALVLSKSGDVLTINGEAFDFTALPDGATLPRAAVTCDWLASDVLRCDGVLSLTLLLPHGPQAEPTARFPAPIDVMQDGEIVLPSGASHPETMEAPQ